MRAAGFCAALLIAGFTLGARSGIAQPAAPSPTAPSASTAPASVKAVPKNGASHARPAAAPRWNELTPAQQQALAPLASEWNKLSGFRKHKWLVIGNRFASMKPAEQQRLQERMRAWAKLTPEQRRLARESYARSKKLNQAQKSAQWRKYQQLPEEQKRKLAADAAASRKHVAALPTPTAQARNHKKIVPPIKSAPKRVLERSVTPQAASQSALQPSPQPTDR